ncbi:uncharacterized protein LY79DRAFT_635781 [Colletotrichum navitas]|uniref:Tat pathway signal sequence n=1 Tax=Colletotrichum navitas TaxID=681940 RepID=A0AAD8PW39_9PEZI|nr:uncharacterized protein LY79DRAFT_635781 [Colletotrichum navitas]KAK1585044.1 hypothetical protein LY79DRAFT_635781 [Colletotrichum navitas]
MRTSFFQPLGLLLAAASQAVALPQQSGAPPAIIPPPCDPIVPEPDLAATYDRWFDFQKAYLFDKDVAATFGFFSSNFTSKTRWSSMSRDEYWANDVTQGWASVSSYPTDASFRDNKGHVAYDMGVNRTGHAGDDFVWEHGCIVSHQQTRT